MTRPRRVSQESVENAIANLERTSVILAGVAQYDQLPSLKGPAFDMEMMAHLLVEDDNVALFAQEQVIELENPSSVEFRRTITEYAQGRSARGDILLLYFSGHGATTPSGGFAFCLTDSKIGFEGSGVLPLSVVSFEDVAQTLAAYDVHPVFIVDACFSGATAPHGHGLVPTSMEAALHSVSADSYGLLASSSSFSPSIDTPDGGAFTQALYSIAMNGLLDNHGRRLPFITLDLLATPLEAELAAQGHPLSRSYVGKDLPLLPIAKNTAFRPQSERFAPYMKQILTMLWNVGDPKEQEVSAFAKLGQGAYANHSKLSLAPWALVEDVTTPKVRRLTKRGRLFAQGKAKIPRVIIRDPMTNEWIAAPDTDLIAIGDVP